MDRFKIKNSIDTINKNGIYYLLNAKGKVIKFKPWLGNLFSYFYNRIMEKSVFPKKFNGSIIKHYEVLRNINKNVHNQNVIDIALGSGNAIEFLDKSNYFTGVDISAGLLRIANKKFQKNGFPNFEFYVADACTTPFNDNYFDSAICNLSLNFIHNIDIFISELRRILKPESIFFCSVPVPERKSPKAKINGTLFTEEELKAKFQKQKFEFVKLPYENGALLYFNAIAKK